jgi:hypothetical protein
MVKISSFPVLTRVRTEVRMSRERDVRKKRSAGKAGVRGVASEVAMAAFYRNIRGAQPLKGGTKG